MKTIGIVILVAGLALGAFALDMDVSVHVPAQDLGYGLRAPEATVANLDKMAQRQNFLIFSGVLAVVGAILAGFASMRPADSTPAPAPNHASSELLAFLDEKPEASAAAEQSGVSICPKCRSMGPGDAAACCRCGSNLQAAG